METRWSALMPDARNVTPLYLQLARNLATAIHCGVWSAGEALPSERTLSDAIGVSRITARKAIELLVEQGLIRRARGAGSFITPRVEDPLSRLTGFTKKMQQRGFRPDSVWLGGALRAPNPDEPGHPRLSPPAAARGRHRHGGRAFGAAGGNRAGPAGDRRIALQLSGATRCSRRARVAA